MKKYSSKLDISGQCTVADNPGDIARGICKILDRYRMVVNERGVGRKTYAEYLAELGKKQEQA